MMPSARRFLFSVLSSIFLAGALIPKMETVLAVNKDLRLPSSENSAKVFHAIRFAGKSAEDHVKDGMKLLKTRAYSEALKEAEAALSKKPGFAPALLLKSQALIGGVIEDFYGSRLDRSTTSRKLREAADILESYILLIPIKFDRSSEENDWSDQVAALREYSQRLSNSASSEPAFYLPKEVTTKARIISRAEPNYTPAAQRAGISGTVTLLAVLGSDGAVRNVLPVQTLPLGLTYEATKALQSVKFEPATKDGRVVSQLQLFEYDFHVK